MPEAVIVDAVRTPIGRAFKGSLASVRPDDMSGFVIQKLMERNDAVDPASIVDVSWGCGLPHHASGMNIGRNAALLGGLPDAVPGHTVNRYCSSSLQTIRESFHAIKAGEGDTFIAGGVESCSMTLGKGVTSEDLNPKFTDPERDDFINLVYIPMGNTAENVAKKYDISRERMDEFAVLSQNRAVEAQKNGFFDREIMPYPIEDGVLITADDGPRANTTLEKLATLPPVFDPEGRVTAGNACPLNDGAAAALVMDQDKANSLGLKPRARIIASAVSGLAPEIMGVGPIEAVTKVLAQAGMSITDIDIVELNEAFAAQVLPVCDELGISIEDQLNPHGGAIALGHPFGMTGARIMATLLNDLETLDKTYGLETMCVGGGMGMAMIVERLR